LVFLSKVIEDVSAKLYEKACKTVPTDVQEALKKAHNNESNELARLQINQMLENIKVAKEDDNVICQDLGIPCFFIKLGTKIRFDEDLREVLARGMKKMYEEPPNLRTYQVNPFGWNMGFSWKGVHTPFVYIDILPNANYIEIKAFPKGGGSAMWGKVKIDEWKKSTLKDVKKFVLESLLDVGPKSCPPYIIGVGIGGTIDHVGYLAKLASARPINKRHPDPKVAQMELDILEAVNKTGIGVMGLGGNTTALAVNIEYASNHLYITPMAFELNCWPGRQASARIFEDGTVEYL
jgi:tartrate/fumarate subfamily iron-sulfur-dependent hydro-lyase alpha chain